MSGRTIAPLAAIAASLGLILVYLAFGGATYEPADVADPCATRDLTVLEDRDLFETIALSSLDGAACDLGVSREELTLALASEEATQQFADDNQIERADIERAVRAGLIRAVDDAAAAGKIEGLQETLLRQVAENAPVGPTISALQALPGDNSVQDLLGRLDSIPDLNLDLPEGFPGLEDIPGYQDLQDSLP